MCALFSASLYGDAFKIMGGFNLSRYSMSPEEEGTEIGYRMGFCAGGGIEFSLSSRIALEVDCLLSQKGTSIKYIDFPDLKFDFKLGTVCIPMLARINIKSNLPFYSLTGIELSIISSHDAERKIGREINKVSWDDLTRSFAFGIVAGIGFEIKVNKFQDFFFECRYHYGFTNILIKEFGDSMKPRAFGFMVGIKNY